jgi:putative colanic acid biosynthesis acetyltransferase WcaF
MPPEKYVNRLPIGNLAARLLWGVVYTLFFRLTPSFPGFWAWRRMLLRLFGAKIGSDVNVYASSSIWAPWNLEMEDGSCLGPWTICYCVDRIKIGRGATVSQYAFLCTASHDIHDRNFRLTTAPIHIGSQAWVAADAFVGPGVNLGEGAVLGARAAAFKSVPAWTVAGGNPALPIKTRKLRKQQ